MKLEGSLDAFSLPDIFQLLSYTKKTGGLRLQHAGGRGVVFFVNGTVTGAAAEGARQSLARRLVGQGLVDDAAITDAVASALAEGVAGSGSGVVRALLASGSVSAEVVAPIAFDQLHDAVFELLRWPSGDFALSVDQLNPDDVGLRLPPDEVVTRAQEQQARWAAASAVVPSPDVVPVVVGSSEAETVVRPGEWQVLRLVDGRRRVAELVDLAGAGQLATVVALAGLVERGLVDIRPSDAGDPVTDTVRRVALLAPAEGGVLDAAAAPVAARVAAEPVVLAEPVEPAPAPPDPRAVPAPEQALVAELPSVEAAPTTTAQPPATVAAPPDVTAAVVEALSAADDDVRDAHPVLDDPGAAEVVPLRSEPFLAARQPDFAEPVGGAGPTGQAVSAGSGAALATAVGDPMVERDPSVNRSLLLRLIAGVRGL